MIIKSDGDLIKAIMLAHSRGDTRLLRINAGMAWIGQIVSRTPRTLTLLDYRPVQLAQEGVHDMIGLTAGGQFVSVEAKYGTTKITEAQENFANMVINLGGRSGFAHSVEEAAQIIRG